MPEMPIDFLYSTLGTGRVADYRYCMAVAMAKDIDIIILGYNDT
jgi:hypothetical protein